MSEWLHGYMRLSGGTGVRQQYWHKSKQFDSDSQNSTCLVAGSLATRMQATKVGIKVRLGLINENHILPVFS